MSSIHIVRRYPHAPDVVWRAVTEPDLVARWTVTGQGARPVGFSPIVGTRFQLVARPTLGWSGVVDCEVLEVREPWLLRYSWVGDQGGRPTCVTYRLVPDAGGTRFTYDHTGFSGPGGIVMSTLLGSVRRKMLDVGLPAVLDELGPAASTARRKCVSGHDGVLGRSLGRGDTRGEQVDEGRPAG